MNIRIKSCTLYQKRLRLKIRIWEILFRNYSFILKEPFCMLFIFKILFVITETQLLILFCLWYSPLFDVYPDQPWDDDWQHCLGYCARWLYCLGHCAGWWRHWMHSYWEESFGSGSWTSFHLLPLLYIPDWCKNLWIHLFKQLW